jgi:hypothetical protein
MADEIVNKIRKLPISATQRWRNRFGKYGVPCWISQRWLQFPKKSAGHYGAGEFIDVNVMTTGPDGNTHRLCSLVVTREDLLRVINAVEDPQNSLQQ